MDGNFSVNKTTTSFSAIGVDHVIEQENRAMKVLGGIKGIANNQKALDQYFLTVSEMGNIIETFCETFKVEEKAPKRDEHYQLTGCKNKRNNESVDKVSEVLKSHDVNFEESEIVYNVLTNKVLPNALANEFLAAAEGEKLYRKFIEERLVGLKSIWDPLTKRKLPTSSNNKKTATVSVGHKLINANVREERKLMTRFIIASRSRSNTDLPSYLGKFEFSVVPRSLCNEDGDFLQTNDKSSVANEIVKSLSTEGYDGNLQPNNDNNFKAIIFDGMAVANRINIKKSKLKSCSDYASAFVNIIKREARDFHEIRVVFDRYISNSLKANIRSKRTHGLSVRYKISDEMIIEHLSTKQFLSDI